jgi:short-subunit dehydrogenase involved in D-alanine esterification of teichoic acids
LLRDKELGPRVVPILVDEARTFGMEGLFRQIGIYNPKGQLYTPVDKDQVMYYREDKAGQILQEGINEAGGMASWIAAATSYSTNNRVMIPFYIYYSMFGFQRIGDLAWAAGDMQARGFLLGGTSGRTTLNGEGLQHEDGHSHILAGTIPNCISYDPTFAHEVAVIMHSGLKRMVENQENVFFYLTLLNENYAMPGLQAGTEAEILKGMYLLQGADKGALEVNLLGVVRGCKTFAPDMLARGSGQIINIASFAGLAVAPGLSSYGVAKGGVVTLSEGLRGEFEPRGLKVSVVCPAFFKTNLLENFRGSERMRKTAAKLMEDARESADDIAKAIVDAAERGVFLIIPTATERRRWWMKRWFPEFYYKQVQKLMRARGVPYDPAAHMLANIQTLLLHEMHPRVWLVKPKAASLDSLIVTLRQAA